MLSAPYFRKGNYFKYDSDNAVVHMYWKPSNTDLEAVKSDNKEWQAKYGKNLWDLSDDGFVEIDRAGLSCDNWENIESRDYYLDAWIQEIYNSYELSISDIEKTGEKMNKMYFTEFGFLDWLEPKKYFSEPWKYVGTAEGDDGERYTIVRHNDAAGISEYRYTII